MLDNILKYLNAVALFVLGLTSSVIVYLFQFAYTLFVSGEEVVMSAWIGSYPWNLFAGVGFVSALAYMIWYAYRQAKKDKIEEQRKNVVMKQIITDAVKVAVKDGMKEAIIELKKEGIL